MIVRAMVALLVAMTAMAGHDVAAQRATGPAKRPAARIGLTPDSTTAHVGFRCVYD